MPELPITIVGVGPESLSKEAARAIEDADVVVGGTRNLETFAPSARCRVTVGGDIDAALDQVTAADGRVCVLSSGDPGFFGTVRAFAARFGSHAVAVHPAPSSVSLAFARLGLPWDDAVVVSAHGRPLADAARVAAGAAKAAVLTSPEATPQQLGSELLALGACYDRVAVCTDLGLPDEHVEEMDLRALASHERPWRSVVVLVHGTGIAPAPRLAWGLGDHVFAHRDGMVTKAEVRAVVLGKLSIPPAGVLWDVGAGSGSVSIECARLAPRLRVVAFERSPAAVATIRANATAHEVVVEVIEGEAPASLGGAPDPDRVFLGGGGIETLEAVMARLRPGGRVVATYASIDRAAAAFHRLGNLAQVSVSRGERLPDRTVRLAAENPVFVVWGPDA